MNSTLSLTRAMVTGIALAFLSTAGYAATTTGVVVSTDSSTNVVTIRTEDGRQFSFLRNDATTFDPAGAAASFADLEPGTRVTVTSDQAPSDPTVQLTATQLRIDERVAEAPIAVAANDTMDESTNEKMASRLPSTATPLPLVALAAVGSILAGIGLRLRRR